MFLNQEIAKPRLWCLQQLCLLCNGNRWSREAAHQDPFFGKVAAQTGIKRMRIKCSTTYYYSVWINFNVYHLSNPRPLPVHLPAIRVVLVHGAVADGVIPGHATNLHLRGSACQNALSPSRSQHKLSVTEKLCWRWPGDTSNIFVLTIDCTKDSVAFHLFKDEEEPPAIVVHVDERSGVDEEHDPSLGKWLLGCFSLDFKEELNLDSFMELSEPRRSFAS